MGKTLYLYRSVKIARDAPPPPGPSPRLISVSTTSCSRQVSGFLPSARDLRLRPSRLSGVLASPTSHKVGKRSRPRETRWVSFTPPAFVFPLWLMIKGTLMTSS